MPIQNQPFTLHFALIGVDDGLPITGASPAVNISTGNSASAPATNPVTEDGGGMYRILLTGPEMNDSSVGARITATGAVLQVLTIGTVPAAVTQQEVADAMRLAPSGSVEPGSIDETVSATNVTVQANLDAQVSSRSTFNAGTDAVANVTTVATVTNAVTLPTIPANWITAAGIAASALDDKGNWNVGKTGYSITGTLTTLDALDAQQDIQHGTTQAAISGLNNIAATDIVSAGPITTSAGAVSSVTNVGTVTGNVNGSVGSVIGNVEGNVVGTVADVLATVEADVIELNGYATIDGYTPAQLIAVIGAGQAGKLSGVSTDAPVFRNLADTLDRITSATTNDGRTTVTINVTDVP